MRLDHLAIWVTDLEKMKDFYEKYFKAKAGKMYHNPKKNFRSYFLRFKDGSRLELMLNPEISTYRNAHQEYLGLIHFAISVGSKSKVDKLTKKLEKDGYTVFSQPRKTGDGYYESVVLDPEQNRIEIIKK